MHLQGWLGLGRILLVSCREGLAHGGLKTRMNVIHNIVFTPPADPGFLKMIVSSERNDGGVCLWIYRVLFHSHSSKVIFPLLFFVSFS